MSKILIIDDDEVMLAALKHRFINSEFDVLTTTNGVHGKKLFTKFKPDIVLTDLMMPFASGFELIHYIRDTVTSKTPIVMLSSASERDIVTDAYKLGVSNYLKKPIAPCEIVNSVKKTLLRFV